MVSSHLQHILPDPLLAVYDRHDPVDHDHHSPAVITEEVGFAKAEQILTLEGKVFSYTFITRRKMQFYLEFVEDILCVGISLEEFDEGMHSNLKYIRYHWYFKLTYIQTVRF